MKRKLNHSHTTHTRKYTHTPETFSKNIQPHSVHEQHFPTLATDTSQTTSFSVLFEFSPR